MAVELTIKSLDDLDPGFCSWLAGLVDGEGSPQLTCDKGRWRTELTISLRDDDRLVLKMIQKELGRGSCYPHRRSKNSLPNSRPRYMVKFYNPDDTRFLVALFERYPLRSKKKQVFDLWVKAQDELDKPTQARDLRYLRYLHRAIREARRYKPTLIEPYKPVGKQMALLSNKREE